MAFLLVATTFTFANNTASETEARVVELTQRVEEIRSIDFKEITRSEKRALKSELKEINKELKGIEGLDKKVSVSVGAIIIVVLLLIIIL